MKPRSSREVNSLWLWGTTKTVLFRSISEQQNSLSFNKWILYLMNINQDILAFYWLRFVMWFYFIFHGMTTIYSKEVIIYHVILHWPVHIDRLKKLKWRPINPVSIEIWNSIQLLHFIEYIYQLWTFYEVNMLYMDLLGLYWPRTKYIILTGPYITYWQSKKSFIFILHMFFNIII